MNLSDNDIIRLSNTNTCTWWNCGYIVSVIDSEVPLGIIPNQFPTLTIPTVLQEIWVYQIHFIYTGDDVGGIE
jgi:hypothetical protein